MKGGKTKKERGKGGLEVEINQILWVSVGFWLLVVVFVFYVLSFKRVWEGSDLG